MSVKEFVESTLAQNKVVIFSKSWCPYCSRAKSLFKSKFPDVQSTVIELDERDDGSDIQAYIAKQTGHRTVPSVFIGKVLIGGNDDAQAAFRSGKLASLINS